MKNRTICLQPFLLGLVAAGCAVVVSGCGIETDVQTTTCDLEKSQQPFVSSVSDASRLDWNGVSGPLLEGNATNDFGRRLEIESKSDIAELIVVRHADKQNCLRIQDEELLDCLEGNMLEYDTIILKVGMCAGRQELARQICREFCERAEKNLICIYSRNLVFSGQEPLWATVEFEADAHKGDGPN